MKKKLLVMISVLATLLLMTTVVGATDDVSKSKGIVSANPFSLLVGTLHFNYEMPQDDGNSYQVVAKRVSAQYGDYFDSWDVATYEIRALKRFYRGDNAPVGGYYAPLVTARLIRGTPSWAEEETATGFKAGIGGVFGRQWVLSSDVFFDLNGGAALTLGTTPEVDGSSPTMMPFDLLLGINFGYEF